MRKRRDENNENCNGVAYEPGRGCLAGPFLLGIVWFLKLKQSLSAGVPQTMLTSLTSAAWNLSVTGIQTSKTGSSTGQKDSPLPQLERDIQAYEYRMRNLK